MEADRRSCFVRAHKGKCQSKGMKWGEGSSDSTTISYSRQLPILKSTYLSLLVSMQFGEEMPEMLVSSWKCPLIRTGVKLCVFNIYFSCLGGKKLSSDKNQEVSRPFPPPTTGHLFYEEINTALAVRSQEHQLQSADTGISSTDQSCILWWLNN